MQMQAVKASSIHRAFVLVLVHSVHRPAGRRSTTEPATDCPGEPSPDAAFACNLLLPASACTLPVTIILGRLHAGVPCLRSDPRCLPFYTVEYHNTVHDSAHVLYACVMLRFAFLEAKPVTMSINNLTLSCSLMSNHKQRTYREWMLLVYSAHTLRGA